MLSPFWRSIKFIINPTIIYRKLHTQIVINKQKIEATQNNLNKKFLLKGKKTVLTLTLCIWHFRVVSYVLYSLQFVRITREQTKNKRRNKKSPRVPRNRRHHHHRHFQCINWKRFDLFSIDFLRLCALIFDRLFIHRSSWRICPIEYRTERPSQRARITSNSSHHMRRLWR